MDEDEIRKAQETWGFFALKDIGNGEYAAVLPFIFTCAVVVGKVDEIEMGYSKRWCFESPLAALAAFAVWDGQGEPVGWHRAPHTGERISRSPDEIDGKGDRVGAVGVRYVRF